MIFKFSSELWLYPSPAAWYFISVPEDISAEIQNSTEHIRNGFGSVKVDVRIGDAKWKTSIFPDKKTSQYFLPVKKAIRKQTGIADGDTAEVEIALLEV